MADRKKLEKAFELFINEEDEASTAMMHEYLVELARRINEELQDAELEEADLDFEDDEDLESDMDEIDAEEGVIENEDEDDDELDFGVDLEDDGEEEMNSDDALDDLEGENDWETSDEESPEIMDLVSELEKLTQEFQDVLGGEGDTDVDTLDEPEDLEISNDTEDDFIDDVTDDEDVNDEMSGEDEFGDLEDEDDEDDEEWTESVQIANEAKKYVDTKKAKNLREALERIKKSGKTWKKGQYNLIAEAYRQLKEGVELTKVAPPQNVEGKEVGAGGNVDVNTKQVTTPKGPMQSTDAKGVISQGGEAQGYKPYAQQKTASAKDMGNPDNTVSSAKTAQKKAPAGADKEEGKGVGAGKSGSVEKKSLISKKVR